MSRSPSFLVIMTDQQRVDTLGCYGAPVCRSPEADRFAGTAVRFTQAYSICGLCTPARASIYTGLYPHRHGLIRNSEDPYCRTEFDPGERLLSRTLADAGYRCGLVGKWHCGLKRLPRDFGFEGMDVPGYGRPQDTEEYRRHLKAYGIDEGAIEPLGGGWQANTLLVGRRTGAIEASEPYFVADQAIAALRRYAAGDRPFLLFVNFWGPHAPYVPNEPYASMYDPREIEPWGNFEETFADKPAAPRRYLQAFLGPGGRRSWDECARWAAAYYGFATQFDAQIGRILAAVDETGLAASTVVFLTTDHGDLLGCHGGMHDKCSLMCQEVYHIPLMVRVPGISPGVVDAPTTNMDILPTALDLAGVEPERPLDGRSLAPLLAGGAAAEPDVMCEFNGHHYHYQSRMITDGRWKYVFNAADIEELYDLRGDPWETTNLAESMAHAATLDRLRARALAYVERSGDPIAGWMRNFFLSRKTGFTPYGGARRTS